MRLVSLLYILQEVVIGNSLPYMWYMLRDESLGLHSCAKKHGWMQEEHMPSSSHASIMREAHACSFCVENDDLNKAKKLLLALSLS